MAHTVSLDNTIKKILLDTDADTIDLRICADTIPILNQSLTPETKDDVKNVSIYSCYDNAQKTIYFSSFLMNTLAEDFSFLPHVKSGLEREVTKLREHHTAIESLFASAVPFTQYYGIKKLGNWWYGKPDTMKPLPRILRAIGRPLIAYTVATVVLIQLCSLKRYLTYRADDGIAREHIPAYIEVLRRSSRRIGIWYDTTPLPNERITRLQERFNASAHDYAE